MATSTLSLATFFGLSEGDQNHIKQQHSLAATWSAGAPQNGFIVGSRGGRLKCFPSQKNKGGRCSDGWLLEEWCRFTVKVVENNAKVHWHSSGGGVHWHSGGESWTVGSKAP
ncbi:hypothetical protein U1Q18_014395 [Sarracenia purpurea var. burkii]